MLKVFLLFCVLPFVTAWGPVSHLYFGETLRQYFLIPYGYKQTVDAPDSFYFPNFAQFPTCTVPIDQYHNLVTAGYFFQYARTNQLGLYGMSLAAGYGTHMIADYVGFHKDGGILGSTVPSWVSEFPYMTALDGLVLRLYPNLNVSSPWETDATVQFLVDATNYYHTIDPTIPVWTEEEIGQCLLPWGTTIDTMTILAQLQADSTYLEQALLYFDSQYSTTYQEVVDHFNANTECIVEAISQWYTALLDSNASPEAAQQLVFTYVDNAYTNGRCVKPTSK